MSKAIATATALLCLCAAPSAKATYDPIGSGTTTIAFEKSFLSTLEHHGVTLSAKAPAKLKGTKLTLPASGGEFDPLKGKGTVTHEGSLVFSSKRRNVPIRQLDYKAKQTPLIAKVGGSQLKLAKAKQTKAQREGFGERFQATRLTLTQKLATRLNKKLGLKRLLKEGTPFARATTAKAKPLRVELLPKGSATYSPDPTFKAKLDSLFVSVNPIFPAEAQGGVFSFPIGPEGAIAPDASQGTLKLTGDLEFLQLGAGQVFWRAPWLELSPQIATAEVDLQPTPAFPGAIGRVEVFGATVASVPVSQDPKTRTISAQGIGLTLSAQSADAFNRAFTEGKATFSAGEGMGVLGFGAWGR